MKTQEMLLMILRVTEALAFGCSLVHWKRWKGTPWRWFSLFLLFIVGAEAFGVYTFEHKMLHARNIFFNYILIPAEFGTAFSIFYTTADSRATRRITVLFAIVYLLSLLADLLFLQSTKLPFFSASYMTGSLLLLVLILWFFISLTASSEILSFANSMLFWVCSGWLIFYLGSLPYYGLRNTLLLHYRSIYFAYSIAALCLNVTMYLLFAIGYLWSRPR